MRAICLAMFVAFAAGLDACSEAGSPAGDPGTRDEGAAPKAARGPAAEPRATGVPQEYAVRLTTTKGDIVIDVKRRWSPNGADRFHELVTAGYFEDIAFFRVVEGFMAQAGIHGDPAVNREWRTKKIKDDPVVESNSRGTVSFATSGRDSRTTQFFISFGDNSRLDGMGFSPFGKVRDMAVVDTLYSGYGEGAPRGMGPSQGRIQQEGNAYLKQAFPELDYILKAQII